MKPSLSFLPIPLSVCQIPLDATFPNWIQSLPFWSITRTEDELSLVLPEDAVKAGWKSEPGWRAIKVNGILDFSLTGILASIASPLAADGVSIFTLSTFNTDYILVKYSQLQEALNALAGAGFQITSPGI